MTKYTASLDDDLATLPAKGWTRKRFQSALERRYSPRIHMSLILAACGFSAMIVSSSLLGMGVDAMLVRYPIAILVAYGVFLVGVWTWLRAMGFVDNSGHSTRKRDLISNLDIPSGSGGSWGGGAPRIPVPRGGGGTFDGGGASGSFVESRLPLAANLQAHSAQGSGASSSAGKAAGGLLDGIDGDGLVLLLLALALVAAIFLSSGYLIWCAPDVLTEAAFGAALTGTLARPTKNQTPDGWIGGVVRKTIWPFVAVLVVATIFAGYAAYHYPEASTFRQAVSLAVG